LQEGVILLAIIKALKSMVVNGNFFDLILYSDVDIFHEGLGK
jgi:hypothetical protein